MFSAMPVRCFLIVLFLSTIVCSQEAPTLRSRANLVVVPTLVKDVHGHVIYGLTAKDFVIEDNGVPQTVRLDDSAEFEPLSIVVALQTGRRAKREYSRIHGITSLIGPLLEQPETQVAVVEFDSHVRLVSGFTQDATVLKKVFGELQPGDGGSAILDAIKFSVDLLENEQGERQRVLLLVSEARDHGSHTASVDGVLASIGKSNAIMHSISFSPALSQVLDTERGSNRDEMTYRPDLLAPLVLARNAMKKNITKTVTEMSGGEYQLFDSRKQFETEMVDFTNRIHSRYSLSFEPHTPPPGLHRIRVELKEPIEGVTVTFRSSYWATAGAN
jgi:VWFA-related protein